jgi:hypothetical protein
MRCHISLIYNTIHNLRTLSDATVASALQVCGSGMSLLLTVCTWVAFSDVTFIPSFARIRNMVQNLKMGHTYTCADLINLFSYFLGTKADCKTASVRVHSHFQCWPLSVCFLDDDNYNL